MNKARRNSLKLVLGMMDELSALIENTKERLQDITDEEEEALGNLPESFQDGERGQQMQEYIDTIENVIDNLDDLDIPDLYQKIEEIIDGQ